MGGFPMHAGTSPAKQAKKPVGPQNRLQPEDANEINKVDPITGGNNAAYEKGASQIMENYKKDAKQEGLKPGMKGYTSLMEKAKAEKKALADSLKSKSATPQKNKLFKGEHPDTYIYEGDDKSEKIIDLEDRIGFLKEDAFNQDGKLNKDQQTAMDSLTTRLKKVRGPK